MDIVIATGAMSFGPESLQHRSLGGSESAALMLGKALAAKGHRVVHFCNLPDQPSPDFFPSGQKADDGVTYVSIQGYAEYITGTPTDLLIITRDPGMVSVPAQAKKKVLWSHDVYTVRGMGRALDQMQFTFDEIWTVSEWHRQQVHEATGFPLDFIVALRNGIVPIETTPPPFRSSNTLLYAARPERGLENLIRPGGIMDRLPEYNLKVCMYDHFPEHMRDYYQMIFARMAEMSNVEFIGPQPQASLRQLMAECTAYIYPTQFEETSCIIAREAVSEKLPFFTTSVGALPETLGDCGIFFEEWCDLFKESAKLYEVGSDDWCEAFAEFMRENLQNAPLLAGVEDRCAARSDLYWDGVADLIMDKHAKPKPPRLFSHVWSMMQDGDVIPALEVLNNFGGERLQTPGPIRDLYLEICENYPFLFADDKDKALADYYERQYIVKGNTEESELNFRTDTWNGSRCQAFAQEIARLPAGSRVFEYGCGPGHIIGPLAEHFPHIEFVGYDHSPTVAKTAHDGAAAHGLKNLYATGDLSEVGAGFDYVIASEVLEHVIEPWTTLAQVESFAKPGGRVAITVPYGRWEPISYERIGHWHERYHIWEIDLPMLREMTGPKGNPSIVRMKASLDADMRHIGNLFYAYDADHKPTHRIDALLKAARHSPRQTVAAAVIAMNNEDTIIRMLNSIERSVQYVQIAMGPSQDNTKEYVQRWAQDRPWVRVNIIDVPKIEAWKFGFDDARNASTIDLSDNFDWMLWIDTDEYLSGNFRKYLRLNCLDGYMVAQHHFTCEPRGVPAEIDRPARLIRTDRGYRALGHIHEHFEVEDGGPGRCYLLPDVDIGHGGYVNEEVRRTRFFRNFPLLEWDHKTDGGKRKLHKFLWLRDIVHRMRFTPNPMEKQKYALEGIRFFDENWEQMATFGPGLFHSLNYMTELNTFLNRGVPVNIALQLEDGQAQLQGRFTDYSQVERIMALLLKKEIADRQGKYY